MATGNQSTTQVPTEQQERILQMLGVHFPDGGLASLSPQALSVIDSHLGFLLERVPIDEVTPAQIRGVVELYHETWDEGWVGL